MLIKSITVHFLPDTCIFFKYNFFLKMLTQNLNFYILTSEFIKKNRLVFFQQGWISHKTVKKTTQKSRENTHNAPACHIVLHKFWTTTFEENGEKVYKKVKFTKVILIPAQKFLDWKSAMRSGFIRQDSNWIFLWLSTGRQSVPEI